MLFNLNNDYYLKIFDWIYIDLKGEKNQFDIFTNHCLY